MNERRKKLLESIGKFNKDQKMKVVEFAKEVDDYGLIPTGVEAFDKFIGGGFKRGGHTILWGGYSVGKTAMVLTAIANAQKEGHICCYVNLEKPIDKERFEFFGINLDEMLYIEAPNNAEQALEALRQFSQDKVIDMFIIDSIQGLCPKATKENKNKQRDLADKEIAELPRVLSKFYKVVNADIFRAKAAVVWIGQTRTGGIGTFFVKAQLSGGKAQEFFAYQMIFMRTGQTADAPIEPIKEYYTDPTGKERYKTVKKPIGFDCVFRMDKTNSSKSVLKNETLHLPYYNKSGFHEPIETKSKEEIKEGLKELTQEAQEMKLYDLPNCDKENLKEKSQTSHDVGEIEVEVEKPKKKRRGRPKKEKK